MTRTDVMLAARRDSRHQHLCLGIGSGFVLLSSLPPGLAELYAAPFGRLKRFAGACGDEAALLLRYGCVDMEHEGLYVRAQLRNSRVQSIGFDTALGVLSGVDYANSAATSVKDVSRCTTFNPAVGAATHVVVSRMLENPRHRPRRICIVVLNQPH